MSSRMTDKQIQEIELNNIRLWKKELQKKIKRLEELEDSNEFDIRDLDNKPLDIYFEIKVTKNKIETLDYAIEKIKGS